MTRSPGALLAGAGLAALVLAGLLFAPAAALTLGWLLFSAVLLLRSEQLF